MRYRDRWMGEDGREGDRVRQHVLGREREGEREKEPLSPSYSLFLPYACRHLDLFACEGEEHAYMLVHL